MKQEKQDRRSLIYAHIAVLSTHDKHQGNSL
jgi:hypothetical protein